MLSELLLKQVFLISFSISKNYLSRTQWNLRILFLTPQPSHISHNNTTLLFIVPIVTILLRFIIYFAIGFVLLGCSQRWGACEAEEEWRQLEVWGAEGSQLPCLEGRGTGEGSFPENELRAGWEQLWVRVVVRLLGKMINYLIHCWGRSLAVEALWCGWWLVLRRWRQWDLLLFWVVSRTVS